MVNKVLLIDRDGVICDLVYNELHKQNNQTGYGAPLKASDFRIKSGVKEAILKARQNGFNIFIISNQPGIGMNHHTTADLDSMDKIMEKELGITPDHIFYCTHKVDSGCECRKPKPGLIFAACEKFGFDPKSAILIGDSWKDINAGIAAGVNFKIFIGEENSSADKVCNDLLDAINFLLRKAS